jgi:hypothetical protein
MIFVSLGPIISPAKDIQTQLDPVSANFFIESAGACPVYSPRVPTHPQLIPFMKPVGELVCENAEGAFASSAKAEGRMQNREDRRQKVSFLIIIIFLKYFY